MLKYILLMFLLSNCVLATQGQEKDPLENHVVITSQEKKILVYTNNNNELTVNVSPKDVLKFKAAG